MKRLLIIFLLISQSACMGAKYIPVEPKGPATAFVPRADQSVNSSFTPVFLVEKSDLLYNRIGTPSLKNNEVDDSRIIVDSSMPTVYVKELSFRTEKGTYKNYVYRIHFEKVPFSLLPFHLTAGKNVGLLVVVTFNGEDEPVLITTVHTCGCYLTFIPTSFLPKDAFPDEWDSTVQKVYGETLPGLLDFNGGLEKRANTRLVILIGSDTHRVKWMKMESAGDIAEKYQIENTRIISVDKLKTLGQGGNATSFFETSGYRKGHVKGSFKPFERIFMSWWAMDLYVGEDKDFGPGKETGSIFYTSLKFWDRIESDMWNFKDFLHYWGWNL